MAVDFWRNQHAQEALRGLVVEFLDARDLVPFEGLDRAADRTVDLARTLHTRLTAR